MMFDIPPSRAMREYTEAQAAHYERKDLEEALGLYMAVMKVHPSAREAGYSRSQIKNIVTSVVPAETLFDAEVELALAHFESEREAARTATPTDAP